MPTDIQISLRSTSPAGGVTFMIERVEPDAGIPQPTDAELIDIGNHLLASDYIQNQTWGSAAELDYISAMDGRSIFPTP